MCKEEERVRRTNHATQALRLYWLREGRRTEVTERGQRERERERERERGEGGRDGRTDRQTEKEEMNE